jgi:hypothetical protein
MINSMGLMALAALGHRWRCPFLFSERCCKGVLDYRIRVNDGQRLHNGPLSKCRSHSSLGSCLRPQWRQGPQKDRLLRGEMPRPEKCMMSLVVARVTVGTYGCPTSSVAQANLTIKINFNILCSFSSSDILTIYLHTFLQSLYLSIHSRKTAFKVSRGISARITRIRTRSSDGVSARYPINFPLT